MTSESDLQSSFSRLRENWQSGDRDREDALELMFLSWWHWAEPEFLTGLSPDSDARSLWKEIYAHFGGVDSLDSEFLYVAWLMAKLFPWGLGDCEYWERVARQLESRWRELRPHGFSPKEFEGRGEYGEYFAGQVRVTEF